MLTRKDKVANVVTTDGKGLERERLSVLDGHLDGLQMCVHLRVHACDCAKGDVELISFKSRK